MTVTASPATTTYRAFLDDNVAADALGEPAWGPLGKVVYERTYSRDIYQRNADGSLVEGENGPKPQPWWRWELPADGRTKEVWAETCRRVALGSVELDESLTAEEAAIEAEALFRSMFNFEFTPAGRHLWVTGTGLPWVRNCWSSGFGPKTSGHFRFGASRLFEGGGVGSNYSADQMAKTSPILGTIDLRFICDPNHQDYDKVREAAAYQMTESPTSDDHVLVVEDSREGWVNAWCELIDVAAQPGTHDIVMDVSAVRHFGAPLRTFGGTASGPAPLVRASLATVKALNAAGQQQRRLTGMEAMAIDHAHADGIVAGGARRSARMSLMSWDSPEVFEFIDCKADQSMHWTTNISVEVNDEFVRKVQRGDAHAVAVLDKVAEGMARDGEPGIVNTGLINALRNPLRGEAIRTTNPCAEATLETRDGDEDGNVAGESCNLGSVNLDHFGTDLDGAAKAFELAARFLYRATFKPYPDQTAAVIENQNRRIGVGLYGFQGWCAAHGIKMSEFPDRADLMDTLASFRLAAYDAACAVAARNGTPTPISVTAVAPTGSIAQLSGASSGINPVYSPHFIRRVRFGEADDAWRAAQAQGYVVEKDTYADNTMVVEYPSRDSILDRHDPALIEGSFDIDFETYMRIVAAVQASFCGGQTGQAVSHTAQLRADTDPQSLADAMLSLLPILKGVTAFPEVSRPQSPLEAITADEFEAYTQFRQATTGDSNDGSCATGACPVR